MESITREQADVIGEVANICTGTAATALSLIINRATNITTPTVEVLAKEELLERDDYILVKVPYTKGLDGTNLMSLGQRDIICKRNRLAAEGFALVVDLFCKPEQAVFIGDGDVAVFVFDVAVMGNCTVDVQIGRRIKDCTEAFFAIVRQVSGKRAALDSKGDVAVLHGRADGVVKRTALNRDSQSYFVCPVVHAVTASAAGEGAALDGGIRATQCADCAIYGLVAAVFNGQRAVVLDGVGVVARGNKFTGANGVLNGQRASVADAVRAACVGLAVQIEDDGLIRRDSDGRSGGHIVDEGNDIVGLCSGDGCVEGFIAITVDRSNIGSRPEYLRTCHGDRCVLFSARRSVFFCLLDIPERTAAIGVGCKTGCRSLIVDSDSCASAHQLGADLDSSFSGYRLLRLKCRVHKADSLNLFSQTAFIVNVHASAIAGEFAVIERNVFTSICPDVVCAFLSLVEFAGVERFAGTVQEDHAVEDTVVVHHVAGVL